MSNKPLSQHPKIKNNKLAQRLTPKDICRCAMHSDDNSQSCSMGWCERLGKGKRRDKLIHEFADFLVQKGHKPNRSWQPGKMDVPSWNDNRNIKKTMIATRLNEFFKEKKLATFK